MKKRMLAFGLVLVLICCLSACAASARPQRPSWDRPDRQTIEWLRDVRNS